MLLVSSVRNPWLLGRKVSSPTTPRGSSTLLTEQLTLCIGTSGCLRRGDLLSAPFPNMHTLENRVICSELLGDFIRHGSGDEITGGTCATQRPAHFFSHQGSKDDISQHPTALRSARELYSPTAVLWMPPSVQVRKLRKHGF